MAHCHTVRLPRECYSSGSRGDSWRSAQPACRLKQLTLRRIISLDLDQGYPTGSLILWAMTEEALRQPKKETKPPRLEEIRQNLEDYANDLRAFIERLRKKLN